MDHDRSLPYVFKGIVFNNGAWYLHQDTAVTLIAHDIIGKGKAGHCGNIRNDTLCPIHIAFYTFLDRNHIAGALRHR